MKKVLLAWFLLCGVKSQGFDPKDLATGLFDNIPTNVTRFETQEDLIASLQASRLSGCTIVEGVEHVYDLKVEEREELKSTTVKEVTDVSIK